ncbi:MAG: hypothetical protein ABIR05_05015 [Luteimonas sp.]
MNRKLQRSATALTATAAVFGLLLFAGGPPQATVPATVASASNIEMPADAVADLDAATSTTSTATTTGNHRRRSRAALALPYFSFAQGLRRVTGS